jgi:hypothetical protein
MAWQVSELQVRGGMLAIYIGSETAHPSLAPRSLTLTQLKYRNEAQLLST